MTKFFLIFTLTLTTSIGFAQFDSTVFRAAQYRWTDHRVNNDLLTDSLLFNLIIPHSDTILQRGVYCLDHMQPDSSKRTRNLIFFTNINNDKYTDIVFDPDEWGCGLVNTYLFYNKRGTYKKLVIPSGYVSNTKWKNNKLVGIFKTIPSCCASPFTIINYIKIKNEHKFQLKYSIIFFNGLADFLNKNQGYKKIKFDKDTIILNREPKVTIIDSSDAMDLMKLSSFTKIALYNNSYYLFRQDGDFGLIAVRSKVNKIRSGYLSKKTYYIGWAKLK